jgi:UDP-N-acetylmuramyl pentapeptide phosphotransferase/UDP-N-acetylglucosamine-1-phosphate transferase
MTRKLGPGFELDEGRKLERPTVPEVIGLVILWSICFAVFFLALWLVVLTGLEVVGWVMTEEVGF